MAGVTPNGIHYPDGASKAKNLGPELEVMAHDIDTYIGEQIDAENPIFVQEAEEAVDDALAAARIVQEAESSDLNAAPEVSTVFVARGSTINRPTHDGFAVLHMRFNGDRAAQIAVNLGNGRIYTRRSTPNGWEPWEEIPRLIDLIDAGALPQKSVHMENGAWIWSAISGTEPTHYVLPDHTGALIVRSTAFPTPSATAPELDW